MLNKFSQFKLLSLITLIICQNCAYSPPLQEMSDARQSIRAATEVGVNRYFPTIMQKITEQLADAEKNLDLANYQDAEQQALIAKNDAIRIRNLVIKLLAIMEIITQYGNKIFDLAAEIKILIQQALDASLNNNEDLTMLLIERAYQQSQLLINNQTN